MEMTLAGKGQHAIAETFNKEGIPPFGRGKRQGKMWHRSYISKIINSSTLVGTLTPHEMVHDGGIKTRKPLQPISGYYPAIVSEEEWSDLVALTKAAGRAPQQRQAGIKNVLAGLAVCPICEGSMTRVMKGDVKKAGRPKLVCTRAKAGAGCEYHGVDLDAVELAVRQHISAVLSEAPTGNSGLDVQLDAARSTVYGIDDAIERIVTTISEDGASPSLRQALSRLEGEREVAEAEVNRLDAEHSLQSGPTLLRRWAELDRAADASLEELNTKLRTVFEKVVVDYRVGELEFVWKGGEHHSSGVPFAWVE